MTSGPLRRLVEDAERVDRSVYESIAATRTPALDTAMSRLSRAADYSKLSLAAAGLLAAGGGPRGRAAAVTGLASVGVTAAVVNIVIKPLARRRRPERGAPDPARHVAMPISRSFPSGHSAAAFAFAAGAGSRLPASAPPLTALATLIAYSRVHTGVHYPGDVIAGAVCGASLAAATVAAMDRRGRSGPGTAAGQN